MPVAPSTLHAAPPAIYVSGLFMKANNPLAYFTVLKCSIFIYASHSQENSIIVLTLLLFLRGLDLNKV